MFVTRKKAVFSLIIGLLLLMPNAVSADEPTASWTSPASGSTLSGKITLQARATPAVGNARISKWCLKIDGVAPSNSSAVTFNPADIYGYPYGADLSNGCWISNNGDSLEKITLSYDATTWANKAYSFALTATDSSGRSSNTITLSITISNGSPIATWISPDSGSTLSGKITLQARATPAVGTARISKWCLKIDGATPSNSSAVTFNPADIYGYPYGADLSNGCWISNNGDSLEKITLSYGAANYANKTYSFALTATDSSGRSSNTITLPITMNTPGANIGTLPAVIPSTGGANFELSAVSPADVQIAKWCINFNAASKLIFEPNFFSSSNDAIHPSDVDFSGNCWSSLEDLSQIKLAISTSSVVNGKYPFSLWNIDENGHESNRMSSVIDLNDLGLKPTLSTESEIIVPGDDLSIVFGNPETGRTMDTVVWFINGKKSSTSNEPIYGGPITAFISGSNDVIAIVTDSLGNVTTLNGSYKVKWFPLISVPELEKFTWFSPASPSIKVLVTLVGKPWSGVLTVNYRNSTGKTVNQVMKISKGSGVVKIQPVRTNTRLNFTIAANKELIESSFVGTMRVQVRPPDPIYTSISISVPSSVIWPNAFQANIRVSGKGTYACTVFFQRRYVEFTVQSGNTARIMILPTDGVNRSESVRGSCDGPSGSVRTYFETNIAMVTRG